MSRKQSGLAAVLTVGEERARDFRHLADALIQLLTGEIRVNCLAQVYIDRFFTKSALGFKPATFRLLARTLLTARLLAAPHNS